VVVFVLSANLSWDVEAPHVAQFREQAVLAFCMGVKQAIVLIAFSNSIPETRIPSNLKGSRKREEVFEFLFDQTRKEATHILQQAGYKADPSKINHHPKLFGKLRNVYFTVADMQCTTTTRFGYDSLGIETPLDHAWWAARRSTGFGEGK